MDLSALAGRDVVVTGGETALSQVCARRLAQAGARVLRVGVAPASPAAAEPPGTGAGSLTALTWDPRSQASVRALAAELGERLGPLHLLVNHSCASFKVRELTEDGVEATLAVNHLSSFLLTRLLTERLVAAGAARVVNVASACHYRATLNFDDLGFAEGGWDNGKAIRRAKLCTVLFTRALARRLEGTGVTCNAVDPGGMPPDLWANAPRWVDRLVRVADWCTLGANRGAGRVLHAAADPALAGRSGLYLSGRRVVRPSRHAQADPLAERLWAASHALTTR